MIDALFLILVVGMAVAGMVKRHRRLHSRRSTLDPIDVIDWHDMNRRGLL